MCEGLNAWVVGSLSPNANRIRAYKNVPSAHGHNLALVAWGLARGAEDFSIAVGDTVAAGWDTDCNGATVGGLWVWREEKFLKNGQRHGVVEFRQV